MNERRRGRDRDREEGGEGKRKFGGASGGHFEGEGKECRSGSSGSWDWNCAAEGHRENVKNAEDSAGCRRVLDRCEPEVEPSGDCFRGRVCRRRGLGSKGHSIRSCSGQSSGSEAARCGNLKN